MSTETCPYLNLKFATKKFYFSFPFDVAGGEGPSSLSPLLLRFEIRERGQTSASQGRKGCAFQVQAAIEECVSKFQSQPHSRQRKVDFKIDAERASRTQLPGP